MLLPLLLTLTIATVTQACLFTTTNTCSKLTVFGSGNQDHLQILQSCCQAESPATCEHISVMMNSTNRQHKTALGHGSMGTVHRIRHPFSGETFALKTFQPEFNEAPSHYTSAIQREFDTATRKINGLPGFVKSYALLTSLMQQEEDEGSDGNGPRKPQDPQIHLLMEYIPYSMKDLTNHDGRHDWQWTDTDIRCITSQVLRSVRALHHEARLAHRDIKPANILMTQHGQTRLIDFGETVPLATETHHARTFTGTPPYLAPEIYKHWRTGYDAAAADLWSVGMVLLRMYLDDEPWEASDLATDVDFQDFAEDPESYLRDLDFPADIHLALVTLLSLQPSRRYEIDRVWNYTAVIGSRCVRDDNDGQLRLLIDYE